MTLHPEAIKLHDAAVKKSNAGNLAYELSTQSLSTHIDELGQLPLSDSPIFEIIDLRIKANHINDGSIPLGLLSKLCEEIRTMVGFAAIRLINGGISKRRIPKSLNEELDLRLAGILQGSSRLILTASANRDLLNDGLNKGAFERIFSVLDTNGNGSQFLEAVNDLGPRSAKHLRELLKLISLNSAEIEFAWRYAGKTVRVWNGSLEAIKSVQCALAVTVIIEKERISLSGRIELLSRKEKLDLRVSDGRVIRILYPQTLLPIVSALHLDQQVSILCQVAVTENPLTNESSTFYEMLSIQGNDITSNQ